MTVIVHEHKCRLDVEVTEFDILDNLDKIRKSNSTL